MGSKQLGSKFFQSSQICSHIPSALNAGAKRSGATCHMAMPQCCYLAKGAKRPSHTTNTIKFDRIPFDLCNSIKRFDLCPFDQKNSTYLQPPRQKTFRQKHGGGRFGKKNMPKRLRLKTFAETFRMICGAYPVYAHSPPPSQRPAPTTIASRSPFPLGLCSCSTSLSKMGI